MAPLTSVLSNVSVPRCHGPRVFLTRRLWHRWQEHLPGLRSAAEQNTTRLHHERQTGAPCHSIPLPVETNRATRGSSTSIWSTKPKTSAPQRNVDDLPV